MKVPDLPHLQFAVISCLGASRLSGRELRAKLKAAGIRKSGAGFYQLMARMEDAELIGGELEEGERHGERMKKRYYKVTGKGRKLRAAAMEFYSEKGQQVFGGIEPEGSLA